MFYSIDFLFTIYFILGILEVLSHLPPILVIRVVLYWFCMVCPVSGEEVLHETIQFVRLDSCVIVDRCHTELPNYSEYF